MRASRLAVRDAPRARGASGHVDTGPRSGCYAERVRWLDAVALARCHRPVSVAGPDHGLVRGAVGRLLGRRDVPDDIGPAAFLGPWEL